MSDGDKPSFSELDKRRQQKRRNGSQRRSRSGRNDGRSRATAAAYKRKVEERLFGKRGDQGRLRLEERIRNAHGGPNFLQTYREYTRSFGMPGAMGLLMLLLDLEDDREVVRVMEALRNAASEASVDERSLLRSRLRNLEMSVSSDVVADAATDLLSQL